MITKERHKNLMFDSRHLPKCGRLTHGGGGCRVSLQIDRVSPGLWRVRCAKCRVAVEGGTYERTLEMYRKASA